MGIINRDLSHSQQRIVVQKFLPAANLTVGLTNIIGVVPQACSLDAFQFMAFGVSGTPTLELIVNRFIVGTGSTVFNIGSTVVPVAFGTSGVIASGFSGLPAIGSTLTTLLANDVLMTKHGGSNSALTGLATCLVLRPIADIKSYFGII